MFKLSFTNVITGAKYSELYFGVESALVREEELTRKMHWSGGPNYSDFYLERIR